VPPEEDHDHLKLEPTLKGIKMAKAEAFED
jgi:hypothetical protein